MFDYKNKGGGILNEEDKTAIENRFSKITGVDIVTITDKDYKAAIDIVATKERLAGGLDVI